MLTENQSQLCYIIIIIIIIIIAIIIKHKKNNFTSPAPVSFSYQ